MALELRGDAPDAQAVVGSRQGDVLLKGTILKSDHFPGCQNKRLVPILEGCPNFRQVDGLPVFGVAIPTVQALRTVLDLLRTTLPNVETLHWSNMREEPLIYINGRPFVVRETGNPFQNLVYTGIDQERVEDMEERLKADVLAEASLCDGQVLVTDENADASTFHIMLQVSAETVQTPREVFHELSEDGYKVAYNRVPVTDEKAPKLADFDKVTDIVLRAPPHSAFVFNCQMGRGRTTTGMVIASLAYLKRIGATDAAGSHDLGDTPAGAVPEWLEDGIQQSLNNQAASTSGADAAASLRAGHFLVVRSIMRVLPASLLAKATVDAVIDAAADMQNLRTVIADYRDRVLAEPREDKRKATLAVCVDHLERYCMLIACSAHLASAERVNGRQQPSFQEFVAGLPEITSSIQRLVRAFPLLSLELDESAGDGSKLDSSGMSQTLKSISEAISKRDGVILSAHTILKADIYPSLCSASLPQPIPDAPNFRQADDHAPVFGSGISTVEGIEKCMAAMGAAPGAPGAMRRCAVCTNLREEAVLYINGTPYVLREAAGSYTNLKEYGGIGAERLEALEERLKEEVWAEAQRSGGRVHVLRETLDVQDGAGRVKQKGRLVNDCEMVSSEDQLQTAREVYESLSAKGYVLKYQRVPLTDGTAPEWKDMDELHGVFVAAPSNACFMFNCQQGKGRTTLGMVAATLYLSAQEWRRTGKLSMPSECQQRQQPQPAAATDDAPRATLSSVLSMDGQLAADRTESPPFPSRGDSVSGQMALPSASLELPPERTLCRDSSLQDTMRRRQVNYVGARRLTRELANGAAVVPWLDAAVDACSHMINLRTVVGVYRAVSAELYERRTEVLKLRHAFNRDIVALKRYCLLLTYAAYLDRHGALDPAAWPTFSEWLRSMASVQDALRSVQRDPIEALTEIAANRPRPAPLAEPHETPPRDDTGPLDGRVVERVLSRRRCRMLTPLTILKSIYLPTAASPASPQLQHGVEGAHDLRRMTRRPVYLVSNPTVQGMRGIAERLGAAGGARVVVIDTREELAVYLGGRPFSRRDLDMPTASMHHSGIHWRELAKLEQWLREDTSASASQGAQEGTLRVLVHHEATPQGGAEAALPMGAAAPKRGLVACASDVAQSALAAGPCLEARWERVPADDVDNVDRGIATIWQVAAKLREEGLDVRYHRVPLSRTRTPAPLDLQELHNAAFAGGPDLENVRFVVMAKSASTSTSSAFVAHFLALVLAAVEERRERGGELTSVDGGSRRTTAHGGSSPDLAGSSAEGRSPDGLSLSQLALSDGASPQGGRRHTRVSSAAPVERLTNSTVSNLCRALKHGSRWRARVDAAVQEIHSIESPERPVVDVIDGVEACRHRLMELANVAQTPATMQEANSVRRLGRRYLQRYVLLICFRAYLRLWMREDRAGAGGEDPVSRFREWFEARKELPHLIEHCKL